MNSFEVYETDVLVIGGGVTATRASISAHDEGARVILVDKGIVGKSGGGPVAYSVTAAYIRPPDSTEIFYQDMIKSGQGLNNPHLVRVFVEDVAKGKVLELEKFGIVFARTPEGNLNLRQMGGHSHPRDIASFHAASMVNVLFSEVMRRDIKVFSEIMIIRLLTKQGRVVGAVGLDKKRGTLIVFRAKTTILTAGGAGQAFGAGELSGYTTNLMEITGDSYAMAYRVGAELVDMEFVQSIPALAYPDIYLGVLLGEPSATNAKLYNSNRERFMQRYDPERWERTTKDVLASSVLREVKAGRGTPHGGVWMDFSETPPDSFAIFPLPFKEMGIDPKKDCVEMIPAIHYFMGGVRINERCETSVPGLYGAGEAAGGLHGANRLAGCSTADSNVFGERSGRYAAIEALRMSVPGINWEEVSEEKDRIQRLLRSSEKSLGISPSHFKRRIQAILWDHVGVLRNEKGLTDAQDKFKTLRQEYEENIRLRENSPRFNYELIEALEVLNMIEVGEIIARSALIRRETRGGHYREDYPKRDDENWLKNIVIRRDDSEMKLEAIPVVKV